MPNCRFCSDKLTIFLVELQGLLIRTQNCSSSRVGGECTKCNFGPCQDLSKPGPVGPGAWAKHQCQDVITFVELLNNDNQVSTLGRPHNPAIKYSSSSIICERTRISSSCC
jgi:hypothetical protein